MLPTYVLYQKEHIGICASSSSYYHHHHHHIRHHHHLITGFLVPGTPL
jgi:hypothetical protein